MQFCQIKSRAKWRWRDNGRWCRRWRWRVSVSECRNLSLDDSATELVWSSIAAERPVRQVRRGKLTHTQRNVVLLWAGPGEEADGAEQLAAERPDFVSVDHPPPQTLGPHRQSVAQGAEKRWLANTDLLRTMCVVGQSSRYIWKCGNGCERLKTVCRFVNFSHVVFSTAKTCSLFSDLYELILWCLHASSFPELSSVKKV